MKKDVDPCYTTYTLSRCEAANICSLSPVGQMVVLFGEPDPDGNLIIRHTNQLSGQRNQETLERVAKAAGVPIKCSSTQLPTAPRRRDK